MPKDHLSLSEARRIALAAQGFDRPRPSGSVRASHVRSVIRQLGLLQIDFVNVLIPSHYLVLFSRLGPYKRSLLDDLVYCRGDFTEQWAHEASIVPVETWPLLRHRMDAHRVRPWGFEAFIEKNPSYIDGVLEQVRARGPLAPADLPDVEGIPRRLQGTWYGKVSRAVLEAHFGRGVLAVAERRANFTRVFDLTERVLPRQHHGRKVDREDAQRELIRLAARAHGVGAAEDLADYYRMPIRDARLRIAELLDAGELHEVRIENWRSPAYLHPRARLPRRIDAAALLSPFDPVVWHRRRTARLFEFDYRIEIFFPKAKRKWGYYVLPFLLGDRLVARVDLKADRQARRLLVLATHIETHANRVMVAKALSAELRTLAKWLNLDSVGPS